MLSILKAAVVVALSFSTSVMAQSYNPQQPTNSPAAGVQLNTFSNLGCFSYPGDMWDMGPYTFQTTGWCQPLCVRQAAQYFALVNGTNCFCGNSAPDNSDKVSDDSCNQSCGGDQDVTCGGTNFWQIYQDGYRNGDSTGTIPITTITQTWFGHQATGAAASTTTHEASTVLVTLSGTPQPSAAQTGQITSSSDGPNKAVIAAGVVVGIIALTGLIVGIVFYMRHKKQKELEAERRRHESLTTFVTRGEKPPSTFSASDSRLEPSVMFQRRQSDGSIMDNQDYSRRILKVTNPDDR